MTITTTIDEAMDWLCRVACCRKHHARIVPNIGPITEQTCRPVMCRMCINDHTKQELLMALTMTDSQQCHLFVTFADKKGNAVSPPVGAVVAFSSSNTDVLKIVPDAGGDQTKCTVLAVGPLSTESVTCSVTDSRGNPFAAGSLDVTITSGAPSAVVINPDTPVEQ